VKPLLRIHGVSQHKSSKDVPCLVILVYNSGSVLAVTFNFKLWSQLICLETKKRAVITNSNVIWRLCLDRLRQIIEYFQVISCVHYTVLSLPSLLANM
jgi:hypothetical protein